MLNYGKQNININDLKNISKTLKSNFLTQGPKVEEFENLINRKFKSKYCSVVSNGTAALHLSSKILNFKRGDRVVVTPITFVASANSVLYQNAKPEFVDINLENFNLDLNRLETKLKKSKKIKGVIATDYGGNPCDWKELRFLANRYNISLINDNCHAIGSKLDGDIGYAVKYADIVCHSYHAVKNFTTGEGGAILTNNSSYSKRAKLLRNHGIESFLTKTNINPKSMLDLGYNYRLPDILCSLGISQLSRLSKFLKKRDLIAKLYTRNFQKLENIKLQNVNKKSFSSRHLFSVLIDFKKIKKTRKDLFEYFYKNKIKLQIHYMPIYRHKFYQKKFKIKKNNFPNAEKFYEQQVSLPIYYDLKISEVNKVINKIQHFLLK